MLPNIVICSLSNNEIYHKIYQEAHLGTYVSYIRGKRCVDEDTFFCEISASFQFPWYFGENWPALDECLCDLEWLRFDSIFLVIDDFSAIFSGDEALKKRLIEYFTIMVNYWKENEISVIIWLNN